MKTPEIVVQEERGVQLFSVLLKAENPGWGETETPLAKETTEYFHAHPLDSRIVEAIRAFQKEGVDEETMYNLALTYQHPERASRVLEMAAKYKPHVKDPEEKYRQFQSVMGNIDQIFSASPLSAKFATEIERDKNERLQRMEETRARIQKIIDFFRPDPKTAEIQKVSFVPTDPLHKKNSGRAFSAFPGEQIIISYIDNVLNQDHEFSHGIINPIVEKSSEQLTDEQKGKIMQLGSEKLKQDYGDGYFSLLCEELIRTYTELVSQGKKPQTYEDFVAKISSITEDEFQKDLAGSEDSEDFKNRCAQLGISTISTITDFRDHASEYYEQFEKNPLRDLIFRLYQDYSNRPDKNKNFEQFFAEEFPVVLDSF